jgi:hypothetical protein
MARRLRRLRRLLATVVIRSPSVSLIVMRPARKLVPNVVMFVQRVVLLRLLATVPRLSQLRLLATASRQNPTASANPIVTVAEIKSRL